LIVVTTSEVRASERVQQTPQGEPPQHEMALGLKYLSAIERAGGIPVVVPPLKPEVAVALLDHADGVCLSGGPDLDPVAYGQRVHAQAGPMWRELDTFELEFTRAADARGMPLFAVCRGLQVLNVARGGTLHQHLPDVVGEGINHRQSAAGDQPTHGVALKEDSLIAAILGASRADVNSFHHQAVDVLGGSLTVTGLAEDGTVEALEAPDREFMVAVQWHAETLPAHDALFEAFVGAARRFRDGTSRLSLAA
jgi:putative glutamine amidotransferase